MPDGPTAVSDPNFIDSDTCDFVGGGEGDRCGASPAAYIGGIYYACEEHFDIMTDWLETFDSGGDCVVGASDGPVLILANGKVVRPVVRDAGGTRLHPWSISPEDGESVYGPEVDEYHTRLSFEADTDAANIEAVRDRLDAYGFGGGG